MQRKEDNFELQPVRSVHPFTCNVLRKFFCQNDEHHNRNLTDHIIVNRVCRVPPVSVVELIRFPFLCS